MALSNRERISIWKHNRPEPVLIFPFGNINRPEPVLIFFLVRRTIPCFVDVDVVAMLHYAFTTLQIKFQFVVTMESIPFVKVLIKPSDKFTINYEVKKKYGLKFSQIA